MTRGHSRPALRDWRIALMAGVAVAAAAVAAIAAATYEELAKGQLLDFTDEVVHRVEVFGGLELYVSGEASNPPLLDVVNGDLMLIAAGVCFLAWLLVREAAQSASRRLFGFAALGLWFLAFDEQFAVHETVGHNLGFLADVPGVRRPDDLILALYVVPAALFLWVFRRQIRESPPAVPLFAIAFTVYVVAAAADAADLTAEENIEPVSSLFLLAGFATLALRLRLLSEPGARSRPGA